MLRLLFAACLSAGSQAPSFHAPETTDWKQVDATPLAVAQAVDKSLHGLHNVILHYVFRFDLPQGRLSYSGYGAIKDSRTFRIQHSLVGHTEKDTKAVTYVCSNGKLTTIKLLRGQPLSRVKGSWPGQRHLEPDVMDEWFRNCAGALLTGVGTNVDSLTAFVRAATNPAEHMKVTVGGRTLPFGEHKVQQFHITCTKTDTTTIYVPVKPKSSSHPFDPKKIKMRVPKEVKRTTFYEVVIDLRKMLPVTLNCTESIDGQLKYRSAMKPVDWYTLSISKGEKFDKKNFDPGLTLFDQTPAH